eukprot:scaffold110683_cov38-Attheya_sp.AAC.1
MALSVPLALLCGRVGCCSSSSRRRLVGCLSTRANKSWREVTNTARAKDHNSSLEIEIEPTVP